MRNNKKERDFDRYKNNLNLCDREEISAFFDSLKERTCCFEGGWLKMKSCYEDAILYYAWNNLSVDEILERLDHTHYGGFYARHSRLWHPLDIVGSYKSIGFLKKHWGVYEMVYNAGEEIVAPLLQLAVYAAVKRYPYFSCRLKKGFFGYYLEGAKNAVDVSSYVNEREPFDDRGEFYRLTYKQNKIILIYLDGITDSYGASLFLREVVSCYTYLSGDIIDDKLKENVACLPTYRENANEFDKMEIYPEEWLKKSDMCITLEGNMMGDGNWKTKCCTLSRKELENICKSRETSIKGYFLEAVCTAVNYSTDRLKGEIAVGMIWDLRKQYNSETVRNFTFERILRIDRQERDIKERVKNYLGMPCDNELLGNFLLLYNGIKRVPLLLKPCFKVYREMYKRCRTTCVFGCYEAGDSWRGKEMYITIKPQFCGMGCFVTLLDGKAVVTVCNNGTDPVFFEKLREIFRGDGISVFEDREIVKSKIG